MRTLIVSDLHLGSAGGVDVLRRPQLREPLLALAREADRLVLLGDILELRHGPPREALAAARPFFEDLGRALAGREVVAVAGNHDHALIEPWLQRRSEVPEPGPLGVEQRIEAGAASPMAGRLAEWAAPARLTVAYPGLWVRPDVYATHGHYLDCHLTVPTMERLGIAAMGRMLRRPAGAFTGPEGYEAVSGPVFAWIDAVARQAATGGALNGATTVRAWHALGGGDSVAAAHGEPGNGPSRGGHGETGGGPSRNVQSGGGPFRNAQSGGGPSRDGYRRAWSRDRVGRALRARALSGAFTLAVGALNRAGLGPLNSDLSVGELRRAGLRAMGEVAERLGLAATGGSGGADGAGPRYVVFGHTHRAGPLPGDVEREWAGPGGVRLVNTGCWTYDAYFLTPARGQSPYWPGCCVVVEDDGPPVVRRLLETREHSELAPSSAR